MALKATQFKADLEKLVADGRDLELALLLKASGIDEVKKALEVEIDRRKRRDAGPTNKVAAIPDDEKGLTKLPTFNVAYEAWYSEALVLIRQTLPDRLVDFQEHFYSTKNRKSITYENYRIQDALKNLVVTNVYDDVVVDSKAAVPHFRQQLAILLAARKRFESSLFEIRQLVQADLFDSEIESARELLKAKFFRAAGAVAGVVLEKHLKQACNDHGIKIAKKNPGINDLNELLRAAGTIDVPQWRHITLLGDIRNICDHNKQKEPTEAQVADLIDGTSKVLKTIS